MPWSLGEPKSPSTPAPGRNPWLGGPGSRWHRMARRLVPPFENPTAAKCSSFQNAERSPESCTPWSPGQGPDRAAAPRSAAPFHCALTRLSSSVKYEWIIRNIYLCDPKVPQHTGLTPGEHRSSWSLQGSPMFRPYVGRGCFL